MLNFVKNKMINIFPKNRFARSVSVLAGGTVAGQIIAVAASPILTRLYSPEHFGLLAVYSSLLTLLGVIVTLRYHLAIPLPQEEQEAKSLVIISLIFSFVTALLVSLGVWFFSEKLALLLNTPSLASYAFLLPVGMILLGIYQTLSYWSIRKKKYKDISKTKFTQAGSMALIQISGSSFGPIALILGQIVGQAAGAAKLAKGLIQHHSNHKMSIRLTFFIALKNHWRFPLFSTWGGLFNAASSNAPLILFPALFSPAIAGYYFLAQRIMLTPIRLVGLSVAQVFYGSLEERIRENNLSDVVIKTHKVLVMVSLAPALLLLAGGQEIFTIFFGKDFAQAGYFAQLLAPWMYFELTTAPIKKTLTAVNHQFIESLWEISVFSFRVASIIIGAFLESVEIAIVLLSLFSSIHYAVLLYIVNYLTSSRLQVIYWQKTTFFFKLSFGTSLLAVLACHSTVVKNGDVIIGFFGITIALFLISLRELKVNMEKIRTNDEY
ncbi:Membrane protein involved in the export of O-antigen and teichoic acid [Halomonas shengliensis]|uniref:Membrane protein involved in the export of O-antigen and teichoic acid n=1 Tax=Halomonas shengliensis TaxID=419597 RepID=A0A1H0L4Y1_9GAMM|nr:oligosaccharide flippase family protein [Halomonas shengliensis]SDO63289.1 Membrane protein involved in the export of O-antigen and teichoic acid [Halomonas shengliensis]